MSQQQPQPPPATTVNHPKPPQLTTTQPPEDSWKPQPSSRPKVVIADLNVDPPTDPDTPFDSFPRLFL
ncbi:hypothetical protein Tco_0069829 [Tanacetum coccineum]